MSNIFTHPLYSDANIVSVWRMEGNANDSKAVNNGTPTAVTFGTDYGVWGEQGASFNGSTSYIRLGSRATLNFTGNFTVLFWIKTSTANRTIYNNLQGGLGPVQGMQLDVDASGKLLFYDGDTSSATATGSTTVTDNVFHLVAARYDGSAIKVILDGIEDGTAAKSISPNWYSPDMIANIGCQEFIHGSRSKFFNGYIDDGAAFSRAVTDAELLSLYQAAGGGLLLASEI